MRNGKRGRKVVPMVNVRSTTTLLSCYLVAAYFGQLSCMPVVCMTHEKMLVAAYFGQLSCMPVVCMTHEKMFTL